MNTKLVFLAFATFSARTLLAQEAAKPPEVKIDSAPVKPQAGLMTSFAPIVEKVAPSVVQISTSKNVKPGARGGGGNRNPMFDDPFFRRFFGLPDQGEDEPDSPPPQRRGGKRGGNGENLKKEALGLGSGVVVSAEGHILTNNHVIEGADDILIVFTGDKHEYKAKKIGNDPATDLAVLKLEAKPAALAPVVFGDSAKLRVGDIAIAVGNPFALGQTVTMGIISATGRHMGIITNGYEDFIQTDASINPGNSGGALVDIEGRLIGINTAIFSRTGTNAGIGFAVPANLAHAIMDSLITKGRVVRGYLGVDLGDLNDDIARKLNVGNADGALIVSVRPDSPASSAGIEAGDVITEVEGKRVAGPSELRLTVSAMPPGTKVNVKFIRDGKEKRAAIVLAELTPELVKNGGKPAPPVTNDPDVLDGVTVGDIDAEARKRFDIAEGIKGVVVLEIQDDSACYAAGIRVGDVILEIEKKPVGSANDAVAMSEKLKKEKEVLLRISSKGQSRFVVVKEP